MLVVIDIQAGAPAGAEPSALPFMPGYQEHMDRAPALVDTARECGVPVVFFQEAHLRDLIDFGRELDGAEDVHLLEGDPGTEIAEALGDRPDDYVIRKRRYSCFFGTELEILTGPGLTQFMRIPRPRQVHRLIIVSTCTASFERK